MKKFLSLLVLAFLPLAVATDAQAAHHTPSKPIIVITHNIAGGAIHHGSASALTVVNQEIRQRKPQLVMLQEVCAQQADIFAAQHPSWSVLRSVPHRQSDPNCGGAPQVDLIASPYWMTNAVSMDLGESSHSRVQHLTCADFHIYGRLVRGCTTHIKVKWAEDQAVNLGGAEPGQRGRQVERVAAYLAPFIKRGPVVVAGDFNLKPAQNELAPMWRRFQEANQKSHMSARIDYIWFAHTGRVAGEKVSKTVSDHPLMLGAAMIKR